MANHFTLTLDTLAPEGSIARPAQYLNTNKDLTINKGDASYMYVWFDTSSSTSTIPEGTSRIAAAGSYTTKFSTSGTYYYHLVLEDDLNNRSAVYTTDVIVYDTVQPTVESVVLDGGADITKTRSINVLFTFDDNLSLAKSYTLSGDLADTVTKTGNFTADEIAAKSATRAIVLSGTGEEDVTKTVTVTVTDNAGNTSDSKSDSIILDTQFLTGNIVLKQGTKTINDQWTNSNAVTVNLELADASGKDCVGYKIWGDVNSDGGATATTEPTSYTTITKGSAISVAMKFTSGDSDNKDVYAKVIDDAGNETTLTSVLAKVDYSAPSVSIVLSSATAGYVSEKSGFSTVTITPTVNANISGVASYTLNLDGSATTVTGTSVPATLTFEASNMGDEGSHTFSLTVVDKAGNTTTSETKSITKDVTAPAGTITMSGWANGSTYTTLGVTASATDSGAGVKYMTCWCSTTASDVAVPTTATQIAYAANPTHANVDWTNHAESATNYIHIQYVDAVGNSSIAHSAAFGIDTVNPGEGTVKFDTFSYKDGAYKSTSAHVAITYSDATSGVKEMKLTGDITNGGTWESVASAKSVTLTTGDGTKNIYIQFKDTAGNVSDVNKLSTDSCELDTTAPSATIAIYDAANTTEKPAISNVGALTLRIAGADDQGNPSDEDLEYIVYGDFNTTYDSTESTTEASQKYAALKFDSGKEYMSITGLYATKDQSSDGDGQTKTMYVKLKDNAGNITSAQASFVYDESAPEVDITTAADYNRISCVHELRQQNSSGAISPITGKYADEVTFSFTPSTSIQAYQVCAYADATAAAAGDHTKGQIGTTNGSTNMAATGLNSSAAVTSMIRGADYKAVVGDDGGHIVVVYVQDLGGTWSVAGTFTA